MGKEQERLAQAPPISELGIGATQSYGGPKKQYVREYGWRNVIQDFVAAKESEGHDQPIKYLTLAGANATDIGILYKAGILRMHDGKLQVAICDKDYALQIQNSLRATIGEVLVATTKDLHVALKDENDDLVNSFPFDVINCDFCDTALKCIPSADSYPNIESIRKIFEYQRGKNFLLLLTAREMESIHPDILTVIAENLKVESFRSEYISTYGNSNIQSCAQDITQFSLLIYSKLIARFAKTSGYKISDKFVAKYDRQGKKGKYHMVTISLLLESLFRSRNPHNKYEPKYTRRELLLNGNAIPDYVIQKAKDHYNPYVSQLLKERKSLDISQLLDEDQALQARLDTAEKEYDLWWKNP